MCKHKRFKIVFSNKLLIINHINLFLETLFRGVVSYKIDEPLFNVLYSDGQDAPNASIRVMVAMMMLKEGEGISDAKLLEPCHFNSLFRSALGLFNLGDKVPSESTYYLFRKKISIINSCFHSLQNVTSRKIQNIT